MIFFDLASYDFNVFKSKLKDINFVSGATYFIDVYIVEKSFSMESKFKRVKSIPFSLTEKSRDEVFRGLYLDIYTTVSYSEVGSYSDEDGVYYEKAFYICISIGDILEIY
jgi:hypothetical protein